MRNFITTAALLCIMLLTGGNRTIAATPTFDFVTGEDGTESDDPHDMFWYHDTEMVALTRERYEATRGKKMQYLSATVYGKPVTYSADSHIKIIVNSDKKEFTVRPVFTDETRKTASDKHAAVTLKVSIISGPAIQT